MVQPAAPAISVAGNVEGSIVVGDHNFVVNTNNGTIIYKQPAPRVKLRGVAPLPPRKPRGFVGRVKEISRLEAWLGAGEPGFIFGEDGLGKTSLAKILANGAIAAAAPNGVLFVEGVDEAGKLLGLGDLVQRMFDALFESDPPLKVDLVSARTYLSNTRPFVLLSGAALPADAFNRLLDLFPAAPILVDAREGPSAGAYNGLALGPLDPEAALSLLADRSGLALDASNRGILAEIAGLLHGVPAALVTVGSAMAGRRLIPEMTAGLLREIQPESADPVEAALERAYRVTLGALSDGERATVAQAAAAPGLSVDRAWMESRFGDQPVASAEELGLVKANSPRLRLVPGLRSMALEGADEEKLRESLYDRLAELLNDRWLDFGFVGDELGNLLGLLDWADATGRQKIVLYLARVLDPFLTLRGLWEARGRALDHLMGAAQAMNDQAAQAWGLHQMGVQQVGTGDVGQARTLFERARDLRLSLGDREGAAYSQHNLNILGPPPVPPNGTATAGGGLPPWLTGILIAGLAIGLLAAGVLGAAALLPTLRPASTPIPPPVPTATRTPTRTPSPTEQPTASPTQTPTSTGTATPTLPPSLDWTLEPEQLDLSSQLPDSCQLNMVVPRVRGIDDPRVSGFNALVDRFINDEISRQSGFFGKYFDGNCNIEGSTLGFSDDYRVTTWPEDNYMDVEPMPIKGDSATYSSSDLLLSVLMLSQYDYAKAPEHHTLNYDLNRGEEVALSDLFLPDVDYLGILSEIAVKQLTASESFYCQDPSQFAAPQQNNYDAWSFTYFGLQIKFDLYDGEGITPCDNASVLIPYHELAGMLDPQGPLGAEIAH